MMYSARPSMSRSATLASLALACLAATAHAQNVFDDFSSGNDNAWTRVDAPGLFAGTPSTYSVTNGQYRLQQPSYNVPGALLTGALRVDGFASDSQISVDVTDWNDSTNNVISVVARLSQPSASTFQFYNLAFFPHSLAGDGNSFSNLRIDRWNADGSADYLTAYDANAFARVSDAGTYRLVFTLLGSSLTGQLFDISGSSPNLIKTIETTDAGPGALGAGIPGITVSANGTSGPSDATFDNFRVVPTPGAAAILGLGGLLAARRRR